MKESSHPHCLDFSLFDSGDLVLGTNVGQNRGGRARSDTAFLVLETIAAMFVLMELLQHLSVVFQRVKDKAVHAEGQTPPPLTPASSAAKS